jgi:hypothetical protein
LWPVGNYRAITAVSDAIVHLLQSQFDPADFDGNQLQFSVYLAKDFSQPMDAGVSVFLYRVYVNNTQRSVGARFTPDGRRLRTPISLDLHFLLTAWARDASLQHTIAGWMMRILEDTPNFPSGLLNHRFAGSFHADETVEMAVTELSTEELFRIWEVIVNNAYQISVPYVARVVRIESLRPVPADGLPVQERQSAVGTPT